MDCSPLGSSVHGILQARILEWVAISFSRESSQPRDQTQVSCIAGGFFTIGATRKVLNTSICAIYYNKVTRIDFYFLLMSPRYTLLDTHVQVPSLLHFFFFFQPPLIKRFQCSLSAFMLSLDPLYPLSR